ncbi:Ankyrin repeat protein [Planctomycetes bacterium CA13]|uniref:Ankyrin repeat protein n=1 Tax=Novipirellula herctigrandis TaxID=2527986 RepID=A0A5C5YXM6_9BACT|nr:Ankyrin repeat protein [Planctomycetes bacterium CA13]
MYRERNFIDAITNGTDSQLAALLQSHVGGDPLVATISDPQPTNHSIGFGMTLLQLASIRERKGGNPSKVLIDHGAEVDLHSACGLGSISRIESLLADRPQELNKQVDTYFPVQFAITAGHSEVIHCLAEHGDDANRDLRKVAYFGWEDDARGQNYIPWKPIHMASLWGFDSTRVPVAQALASAGADLDVLSPLDGFRPIHLVSMPNRVEMIRFLVSEGVDVDSRTEKCAAIDLPNEDGPLVGYECTALMVAAAEGFPEATTCLLELGADPNAVNDLGHTAMDFAHKRFWDGQPYETIIDILAHA